VSNIAIKGATTGTGTFTIESPATNTDRTLTLPDEAGTVLTSASSVDSAKVKPSGLSYWPAFLATTASDNTWDASNSANTVVPFNSVSTGNGYDTGTDFDTSNNRYVAPVSGIYCFSYSVYSLQGNTGGGFVYRINGTPLKGYNNLNLHGYAEENAAGDTTIAQTVTFNLTANDYVDIVCSVNNTDIYIGHSYFSGHLVAAV
jgi:hypothetical protein